MRLDEIKGNEKLVERLTASIRSGTVSHAYIFEGEAALDKKAFAQAFAKAILCENNPGIGCDTCLSCWHQFL